MSFDFKSHTAVLGGSFNPPHVGHVQAARDLFQHPGVKKLIVLPSYGTPLKAMDSNYAERLAMTELAFQSLQSSEPVIVSDLEGKEKHQYTWQVLENLKHQYPRLAFVVGIDQFVNFEKWNRFPEVLGMCDWIIVKRDLGEHSSSTETASGNSANTIPLLQFKPEMDAHRSAKHLEQAISKFVGQGWLRATSNPNEFEIKVGEKTRFLVFVETSALSVSSSEIREKLALKKNTNASASNPTSLAQHEAKILESRQSDVHHLLPQNVYEYIERNKLYGT